MFKPHETILIKHFQNVFSFSTIVSQIFLILFFSRQPLVSFYFSTIVKTDLETGKKKKSSKSRKLFSNTKNVLNQMRECFKKFAPFRRKSELLATNVTLGFASHHHLSGNWEVNHNSNVLYRLTFILQYYIAPVLAVFCMECEVILL